MSVSAEETDVLSRLGERVETAIATIQQLRRERDELRQKLTRAEQALRQQTGSDTTSLAEENERFRSERDEIRGRLERLLENLERLEEL